ncbi:unnamed protein product [Adineta steineri]|uniref:Cation-transporting P-type ATPase N-terminal domain-containing protein n=1 Tax=Adineta steineri TaxID=433720 RepID=A0A814XFY9_9BILA|nr:unnamed protein product [Adineta steineri]CAF1500324.1 unnamed protein product [Adineta steineri]
MSRLDQDVHVIPMESVFRRFHSDQRFGLSTAFVHDAQLHYGTNQITPPRSQNYFWLLFQQLFMGFNSILWLGGILALIAYQPLGGSNPSITNLGLGIVLFLVIICNASLNIYQKLKSIKIIASFSKLSPTTATVRREGVEQQIPTNELVPGDIILIQMGDVLPADCRFLTCEGLKINSAELTGETKPITVTVHCTSQILMESTNIGFYSSFVEQGMGEAIVIATGDNTILGKMSGTTTKDNSSNEITNLHREVNRFVLFVLVADIISIFILWITWLGWLNHSHPTFITLTGNILNSIGMIVSFLPVGLPSAITLVLVIVAKRMSQQRILGKSLQIVESFNSVSVITTDKTGTLTKNKLVVSDIFWDTDKEYKIIGHEEDTSYTIRRLSVGSLHIPRHPTAKISPAVERSSVALNNQENRSRAEVFDDLILGAALCNNAKTRLVKDIQHKHNIIKINPEIHVIGDSVDIALYNLCVYEFRMEIDEICCLNPRLRSLPFNSENKFMITANRLESKRDTILMTMKGAPEVIIQYCSSYKSNDGQILPLTIEIKQKLLYRQEMLSKNGYRVIAMSQQKLTKMRYDQLIQRYEQRQRSGIIFNQDLNGFSTENYCFLGFFSLFDSPRFDVPDSILKIRQAHIRIAMITGDHPTTATAVAQQVNIFSDEISKRNGIDTFQIEENDNNHSVFRLYRNETLLQEHTRGIITPFHFGSKATTTIEKQPSWYTRWYSLCRAQFSEPKPIFYKEKEKEKIPYALVMTGSQIGYMDDFMWNWVLSHQELVFARTSPEQKLHIIMEFQRRGETVAAIGDGTNDAPSLKYADLGIAMQSGTNVSKEASDMILLDNNFSSLISAIETGRLLADNLKKVVIYLLPAGSWSELWPIMFNMWFGIPLSLSAFLATILCVLNDLTISLAMATEKPETEILSRPPSKQKNGHLLNIKLLTHAYLFIGNLECFTAFFCFCYYWIDNGISFYSFMFTYEYFGENLPIAYNRQDINQMINVSQSVYYCSLCIFQIFNYFSTRTRYASIFQHNPFWGQNRNWFALGAIMISIIVQLIFTQVTWLNEIFDTAPVPAKYVMPTIGFGIGWLVIDELRKLCVRKFPHSIIARIAW